MNAAPKTTRKLWLATQNRKKRAELARLLESMATLHGLDELPSGADFDVVEDAPDFLGNARKKAAESAAFCRAAGASPGDWVLADDSGLCVDALDGRPGVLSARYAGPGADDRDRIEKLLGELREIPREGRGAHFACALALYSVAGEALWSFEGRCDGEILPKACGEGGFGYDPVFAPSASELSAADLGDWAEKSMSFAELAPSIKDRIGHRGKALSELRKELESRTSRDHVSE